MGRLERVHTEGHTEGGVGKRNRQSQKGVYKVCSDGAETFTSECCMFEMVVYQVSARLGKRKVLCEKAAVWNNDENV